MNSKPYVRSYHTILEKLVFTRKDFVFDLHFNKNNFMFDCSIDFKNIDLSDLLSDNILIIDDESNEIEIINFLSNKYPKFQFLLVKNLINSKILMLLNNEKTNIIIGSYQNFHYFFKKFPRFSVEHFILHNKKLITYLYDKYFLPVIFRKNSRINIICDIYSINFFSFYI